MQPVSFAPTPASTAGIARAEDPRLSVHADSTGGFFATALKVTVLAATLIATVGSFATLGPIGGIVVSLFTVPFMLYLFNSILGGQGSSTVHIHTAPVYVPWHQRIFSWIPDIPWQPLYSPGRDHVPVGGGHVPVGRGHPNPSPYRSGSPPPSGGHVPVGGGHTPPSPAPRSNSPPSGGHIPVGGGHTAPPPATRNNPLSTGGHVAKGGGHTIPPPAPRGNPAPSGGHIPVGGGHTPPPQAQGGHVGVGSGRNRK